jgi:RecA/RadA recombinase
MATKAKAKKKVVSADSLEEIFEEQLEKLGLGDSLKLADDYENDVECVTTGFPGLDKAIDERGINCGIPKRRHSEVYSKKEHAGKTSIALAIGLTWQQLGLRVGIIDLEPSITKAYLRDLGYIIDKDTATLQEKHAVRLLQPEVKPENFETDMVYLEKVLDIIAKAADVFDLLIVDSVDAMVSELEAEKTTADNDKAGGIAKKLRAWFRKNTTRRAHVMWLNHASQNIGSYGMPSYYTSGGKSVPRYSTLRFELVVLEKLSEGEGKDPYGFKTRVTMMKNRLGPGFRYTDLHYIFGEGFSKDYDYFNQALKLKILWTSGAWVYFGGEGKTDDERKKSAEWKFNGKLNSYRELRANKKDLFDRIKGLIDGEDVEPEVGIGELSAEDKAAVAAAEIPEN